MYNLKYTIPFIDIDGNNYTIQILEEGGVNSPVELTGGNPAFTVDVNDEDFLYTPTRFSGATLKVVGSDYLQTLFSTDYQKFKVNLVKASTIIWTGFITPEMYSQDYDNSLFELDIECISALSTLEYIDFKSEAITISLLDLIKKCITESNGSYSGIYIPNVYSEPLSGLTISCGNFIDEDGKPENLKTCLEEVCKFLNWTIFEYNGNVYFIDVDYIKAGKTAYTKYDLAFTPTSVTLSNSVAIQNIQSKGNENKLSILGGFNKSVVIASDYEADSSELFPEIKAEGDPIRTISIQKDEKEFTKNYFGSNNINVYVYQCNPSTSKFDLVPYDSNKIIERAGSKLVKATSYDLNNKPNKLNWDNTIEIFYLDKEFYVEDSTFSWNDATTDNEIPIISYLSKQVFVFDTELKLAIDFQMLLNESDGYYNTDKPYKVDPITNPEHLYIPCKLKIGDYYYDGTNWVTDPSKYIKLYTNIENKQFPFDKWLGAKDTNDFTIGVPDLNGHIVNFDKTLMGNLEVTFYLPKHKWLHSVGYVNYAFLKDIKIETQRVDKSVSDDKNEDTKYENVVNESYINALDDITFKITSKNDSGLSFSKVIYNNGLLDKLTSNIDLTKHKPEEYLINRVVNQYSQPKIKLTQIIKPDVLPYSIVTDSYLSGKSFLFTGGSIDYEDNSMEANLIEIK